MSFKLVVLGGSLGAVQALRTILADLPADFPLPLAAVLHRGDDHGMLSGTVATESALPVADAGDKEPLAPGRVFLAPADYHLLVESNHLALSTEAPVHFARPAIDVLFDSAADVYRDRLVGVLLTGANRDGAAGLAHIKEQGGLTVVQDPATAEEGTMPAAALALAEHKILPLQEIGLFLYNLGREK